MKNKLVLLVAFLLVGIQASYAMTESSFNSSSSGTTSATAFVPVGEQLGMVSDLSVRLDNSVTSGFVGQYIGVRRYLISSATAASASVLWFDNGQSGVTGSSFIIFLDQSSGSYFLRRVSVATTTSCTLYSSMAIATTTLDSFWLCGTTVEKPVLSTSNTGGLVNIWVPASCPAAFVIDGNTTSCRISISGFRGARQ